MPSFAINVERVDCYEIEAENETDALEKIRSAHYEGRIKREYDPEDFYTRFVSEGEIVRNVDEE